MKLSEKLPLVAAVVAFVMTGLAVISGLTESTILLAAAVLPLAAGIGIVRRRVWAAHGFALYLAISTLALPVILVRAVDFAAITTDAAILIASTVLAAFVQLALVALYFLAGRVLEAAGARRGWASPWIAVSILLALLLLFLQPFVIPTGAMEETLLIGDHIFVQRFPAPSVGFGDIITFTYPVDRSQTFVKRVIGMPGDRIRISDKILYRNGEELDEPYVIHKTSYIDPYRDNFPSEPNTPLPESALGMLGNHVEGGEVVVPENCYFVLGDNRDMSLDSRYWGFVRSTDIVGKPIMIYHSEEKSHGVDEYGEPTGPSTILRWERVFKLL